MKKSTEMAPQVLYFPQSVPLRKSVVAVDSLRAAVSQASQPALRLTFLRDLSAWLCTTGLGVKEEVRASELLALSILNDVFRYLAASYCVEEQPGAMYHGRTWSRPDHNASRTAAALLEVVEEFPPLPCIRSAEAPGSFLAGGNPDWNHADATAVELLLIRIANINPAAAPYSALFNDSEVLVKGNYVSTFHHLEIFFDAQPPMSFSGLPLVRTLLQPIEAHPDSLLDQLEYIKREWAAVLPPELLELMVFARDVVAEETAMRGFGPGPVEALQFGGQSRGIYGSGEEIEAFSQDKDWMPNLVLIAKSTYVWLDQLSRRFGRPVNRLDEIPDEALDELSQWGFTGLWLIGLWERSEASRSIKVYTGNPEAAPSAYSLYDYTIAGDLGGDEAYQNLAGRAWARGIRLASDMVPNHMGIYSRWLVEHPDWFVQSASPPFPGYTFNGGNLSQDPSVGIYIEDGYWDKRDAAVVFKRVDHFSGETRYVYHGNDGTNMPWNDTAQLNFLLPQVREAVIQTIIHVARMFPIIRFDAAMTLAKKHYQRLWFPLPGDAGAIPSRAEHSMSKEEFDHVFPVEFWREVVDRVAAEAPDTLLLAEAFWLMEGYFVRTLGMHRVYNSAFMNMLKLEENAKYRETLKNVLEFSPEILQRFVNFMNNPDEDTAEAQFGRSDKYFGVAMMMVTMPGLPMFGHGQVEGLREKYGMEYRRAYWDEVADEDLVLRHKREIFPLIRHRYIFSGSRHFAIFDFVTPDGWINENVYAYSNRSGNARALVVFNNAFEETQGCVHTSSAINQGAAESPDLIRLNLAAALNLTCADTSYYIYRDSCSGLEYLEHAQRIERDGIHVGLGGYQYVVLMDWRHVEDWDSSWGRLHAHLAGRGVPSVEQAYCEMQLWPILEPFEALLQSPSLQEFFVSGYQKATWKELKAPLTLFLKAVRTHLDSTQPLKPIFQAIRRDLKRLDEFHARFAKREHYKEVINYVQRRLPQEEGLAGGVFWQIPVHAALLRHLGLLAPGATDGTWEVHETSANWMRSWFLTGYLGRALEGGPVGANGMTNAVLVRCAIAHSGGLRALQDDVWAPLLDRIFWDPDVQSYIAVNHHGGKIWFNKERFETLLYTLFFTLVMESLHGGDLDEDALSLCLEDVSTLLQAAVGVGYDLEAFLECLK